MNFENLVEMVGSITTPADGKATMVIHNIRTQIKTYIESNGIKSLVIGISGGLDSAVVAALCQQEFTGVPLIGVSIPMSSSNDHKEQAQWIGDTFCSSFEEFNGWDGNELFDILEQTDTIAEHAGFNGEDFPKPILQGNMKARLRMITLYDLARKTNGLVLSTDNLSELQMGFWTICGDVGDYGPVQNVGKGFEMPVIAAKLGVRNDIITQPPSDGLMVTEDNTDEAQLGANYKEVDTIMYCYLNDNPYFKTKLFNAMNGDMEATEKVTSVISRYEGTHFKRNGTTNLTREQIGI